MPSSSPQSSLTSPPPSTDSTSTTPRVSSPLNPSTSTPSKEPLTLSPTSEEDDDEPFPHFSFGTPRGHSQSSLRLPRSTPPPGSGSQPNLNPNPSIRSPRTNHDAPLSRSLPDISDSMVSTFRDRSGSRSPNRSDALTIVRPTSSSSNLASSWWGSAEHTSRPWKDSPKGKKSVPPEQTVEWEHTRMRVAQAAKSVLGTAGDVTHELLGLSVNGLQFAPIPGLGYAAQTLLNIWDAVEKVALNRLGCLRLTERCAEILISVRQEIYDAGDVVGQEIAPCIYRLQESFNNVHNFLQRQIHRPFLKRYLKRDDIMREISGCDSDLRDAVGMFSLSIQIRILKQVFSAECQRAKETQQILSAILTGRPHPPTTALLLTEEPEHDSLLFSQDHHPSSSSSATITHFTATPDSLASSPSPPLLDTLTPSQVLPTLASYHKAQNSLDAASDMRDLRQLLRSALHTTSDAQMVEVLRIGTPERPDAIKTMQRALERVVEKEREHDRESGVEEPPKGVVLGKVVRKVSVNDDGTEGRSQTILSLESPSTSTRSTSSSWGGIRRKDTLDREFIESELDALRRMSRGMDTSLPSWTITMYEVDRESKIGVGFFSDVYKGTWRGRTVAVKVLAESTPRKVFIREIEIWKSLRHVNVLPLCGASSASGHAPWFFVSPYMKNGSLVEFLKKIENETKAAARGSTVPPASLGLRGHSRTLPTGETTKTWDLFRFMYEIAKGMEYLHSMGVLHADLKAANVLVDDRYHCVISDFGQSEMKSEAFRISGTPPPYGPLRWQAPEFLSGKCRLTAEMDVYAFAISCVEILSMGRMPWPLLDDDTVRHLVLTKDDRPTPHHPDSRFTSPPVQELLRVCWHRDPDLRPPFSKIVRDIKQLRRNAGHVDVESPEVQLLPPLEEFEPRSPSPDMRPRNELPDVTLRSQPSPEFSHPTRGGSHHTHTGATFSSIKLLPGESVTFTASGPSSRSSSLSLAPSEGSSFEDDDKIAMDEYDGYDSPPPVDERIAEMRNERRYRYLLTHEYNASLVLPLWSPSPIDIGAVGYLSKPLGRFVTLFNAFTPQKSTHAMVRNLPSIYGYGQVKDGTQRLDKRSQLQHGLDAVSGLLTFRSKGEVQNLARRYAYPLQAGHRIAVLCAEMTEYRYVETDAPKKWFQSNVDSVMNIYGMQHHIQKEDLFLVVGTLCAPNYALYVSHKHPNGHAYFDVYSSPKNGQPWGTFTTDAEVTHEGGGLFYEDESSDTPCRSANKVSNQQSGLWDAVLLARLRFKPDHLEPTSK